MNPDVSVDQTTQRPAIPPTSGSVPGVPIPFGTLTAAVKATFAQKPTSRPPAPQITSPLSAIQNGFQMAFNQVMSPTATGNVINGYRIYRNTTTNTFNSNASGGGSVLIRTILQDATHLGAVTVQDITGPNKTYFYFVTSVDTFGQESLPASFINGAGTVTSGTVNFTSQAIAGTNTTTSTTFVSFGAGLTTTITTHGGPVLVTFYVAVGNNTANDGVQFELFRDGVAVSNASCLFVGTGIAGVTNTIGFVYLDSPTAASHTYEAKWLALTGGTATASNPVLQTIELG
jgi:hypothetical protein